MQIEYNCYGSENSKEQDGVSYWVYSNIGNLRGIEDRQKAIIDLIAVLADAVLESSKDQRVLEDIAYAIECPHKNHKIVEEPA